MRPTKRMRRTFVPSLFEQPNLEVRFMPAGLPFVGPVSDSGPQALINQGDLHRTLIDRTNEPGAIITARGSNGTGEGAPKAFDNNASTKWLDFSATTWIQYQFHNDLRRYAISQYTITSGDDSPERDPKSWALKGSNDGVNWTTLDTRNGQAFANRGQTNTYDFANTTPYAYYKLDDITNNSGSITQIAEIQLKGPQAAIRPVAINVGGATDGGFAGDSGYTGGNVNSVPFSIDTSGAVNPAPPSAYQNERWSYSSFGYTLPNLTPGASYTVRLHFAELYYNSIGERKFDVSISGNTVLDDFDILQATGGAKFKAVTREFTAVADANGVISLDFTNVSNGATVSAIEALTPVTLIDTGGTGGDGFGPDAYYTGGNLNSVPFQIDTSGVTNPAPQSAYQTERWSHTSFNYSLPNLSPGAAYTVRLHFAELYYNSVGNRQFDVSINGATVLDDFDVLQATGGAKFKAVTREFTAVADANGVISLDFTNVSNGATVSAIEALPTTSTTDLARGKVTTASSSEGAAFGPANAVDDNSASRWSSGQWLQGTSTGWIMVDLGAIYNNISRIRLNWETAYAADYQIQISADGNTWTAIKTVTGNTNPGWFDYTTDFLRVGRYVRVYATATSAANNNYSLLDLNVYGS